MAPIVSCFVAGTLMILLRRPWARGIKRSQELWFDRAYDEDALAWWISAMGCLVILGGTVFLGIWLFK
jgi:hypothetical protein